ncbi:helical backbone metal receptor [Acidipropionibacterium jensenii]|uniref:helical backbone metal receptor n=1 Tax=Acidipropionibacterium jensenii TaxID=1749 RepID=UPI0026491257|nr:helical backbone metal receptor [Acidipropionibacterium jensenii]MDN5977706.1 helical backbone metal receptor [Acidipropionibacterium jensenii]
MTADDCGDLVELTAPTRRIVSLVPSITEAIALTCPERLVGCTDWCIRPTDIEARAGHRVQRVRGTKNPDRAAIAALRPDLVIANREENRKYDVDLLRQDGIPVWVTSIDGAEQAVASLSRLFTEALRIADPEWLDQARSEWGAQPPQPVLTAVVPVWRDPWMCAGRTTYIADLMAHCGVRLVALPDDGTRYPHVDLEVLQGLDVDRVVLPDEPYHFTAADGPEAFPGHDVRLVDGQRLAWYGPSMVGARQALIDAVR